MKERPILMSTPMVKAILAGIKTQTRRILKKESELVKCRYGEIGDRLFVKETWTGDEWCGFAYKADGTKLPIDCGEVVFRKWKPSIYMPKIASRILLEITGLRIERMNDITCNDAFAEGTPDIRTPENGYDMRDCFRILWDSINGKKHSWKENPLVYVIEFKRIKP
jgi:hypothetical protein